MDLLGDLNMNPTSSALISNDSVMGNSAKPATVVDLLGDLFSATPVPLPIVALNLNSPGSEPGAVCYNKNGLLISFVTQRKNNGIQVAVNFSSTGSVPVTNISFQVAVPKVMIIVIETLKLTMHPASTNQVTSGSIATQLMDIENPTNVPIRLRIKLGFLGAVSIEEMVDFSNFDPSLWS